MQIKGRCLRVENRDPITGIVTFLLLDYDSQKEIRVIGAAAEIVKNTAYLLEGEYNSDGTFRFGKIRHLSNCQKESIDLLTDCVSGVSETIARAIVERFGDDVFSYGSIHGLKEKLLGIPGIGIKKAEAVIGFIQKGTEENDVFQFLSEYQIPYVAILTALSKNPPIKIKDITDNPYCLMEYDVSFESCDRIAIKNHIDPWAFNRIHSMAKQVLRRMYSRGDTRMPLSAFLKAISGFSYKSGKSTIGVPADLAELVVYSAKYIKVYTDAGTEYVSSLTSYLQEMSIAKNLRRLQASKDGFADDVDSFIKDIEKEQKIKYNKEQKEVFQILKTGGIALLLGGPGTGKTTTINGIIRSFFEIKPKGRILLCAPTGRAAARMTELSGHTAKTMHKAMDLRWYNHDIKVDELNYDFIIVDEMSMCDTELFAIFMSAAVSGTTILLSGDYNQIPSVGPGQVLRDLAESGQFTIYRLLKTIRQEEGSLIIDNAKAILEGQALVTGNDFQIAIAKDDNAIFQKIKKTGLETIPQILCPIKKSIAGTKELNRVIQEKFEWKDTGIWLDGMRFHTGDKVIMNTNHYDVGYMNGDVGQIMDIHDGYLSIAFSDKSLHVTVSQTDGMGLSYALTFHKSQGAECDNVLIILPSGAKNMASRELLYTAVTRARKKVWLLAVRDVLDAYLSEENVNRRDCGLKSWLIGSIS